MEKELRENQRTFTEYQRGKWYDPHFDFEIIVNNVGVGEFRSFNEVDSSSWFLRFVENLDQLKRAYEGLTDLNFR